MITSVSSKRCGSYRIYLEGNSPHQVVIIVCELKWFSHISNRHNMKTLMQSCDVFHTQHTIFFATFDTCAGTMWFGHHKEYMCFWNIKLVRLVLCVCVCVCVCVCFGFKWLSFFLLRDVFESLKCCVDIWLSSILDCINVCVFLFLKNCF